MLRICHYPNFCSVVQIIGTGTVDAFGEKGETGPPGFPGLKGERGEKGMYVLLSFFLKENIIP